jgi:hypothetical protein
MKMNKTILESWHSGVRLGLPGPRQRGTNRKPSRIAKETPLADLTNLVHAAMD